MVIAVHLVKFKGRYYKPGEEIFGLAPTDVEELLAAGAVREENTGSLLSVFEETIRTFTKLDLQSYADKAGITVGDGKKDEIVACIMVDAATNGVAVDALSESQLKKLAAGLQLELTGQEKPDDIIALIEAVA